MANINRVGSPMDLCEENYDQTKQEIERQKEILERKQRTKSPFFIGSIQQVNKKISKLDRKLQKYTELVVESRASEIEDADLISVDSARGRDRYQRKEKENKDMNKFAGYFTMKQTFLPGRSERVKNISKVSMQPSKTTVVKKETGKPKFVELHQYPGYDHTELTALPDDIPAADMLHKAADAHMHLDRKPGYQADFENWFYSELSQAVFLDIFWYLFVDKYQSSKNSQVRLFNRAAHNYVKLILYVRNPQYKELFFKEYPSLIAQATYAAYCYSFPDSYKQFGEQFKEDLVGLVYLWIAGIRPAPRIWMLWDIDKLEPPNIKMREEMAAAQKNKKSSAALNMDFLENLFSSNASQYTSTTSLNQSMSRSSLLSFGGRNRKRTQIVKKNSKPRAQSPESSHDGTIIETVAESQPTFRGGGRKQADPRKVIEALTPIRETTGEDIEGTTEKKTSNASVAGAPKGGPMRTTGERRHIASHPACRGPDFTRTVFNIQGQSPLVAHCMRMKNATQGGGQVIYVQRTQVENLPSLDAPTYRDIIKESFTRIREIEKGYNEFYDKNAKESLAASQKHRAMLKEHDRLKKALLAKPKEVKRLSELLILEQNKDQDSVSAGADAALEAALLACQQ